MIPREFPHPDPNLPVLKALPKTAKKFDDNTGVQRASDKYLCGRVIGEDRYYYCGICGGWVTGDPSIHTEDTRSIKGRFGTVYQCRRCMNEIVFVSRS